MIRIGVQAASLRVPFKKALPLIASMHATGVELDARGELRPGSLTETGLRQVRKLLDDYGLSVAAVSFQTRRGYDVAEDLERRIEATKQALQLAYSLGCSAVLNQVGRIPSQEQQPDAWQRLVDSLTDIGRFSQRAGAWLAMTTGTDDGCVMRSLVEALPEGSVRVNFDPGNLIINGFSADESLRELAPHVAHIQARDGVRDLARGRGLEVPLGRGSTDFPSLLGTLLEYRYQGFWTVARESSNDPVRELSLGVQYLRNLAG